MIFIPVSNGELIDKLTILEIKKEKISNDEKLIKINKEFNELIKLFDTNFQYEYNELKKINLELWNIEDNIRVKEKNNEFDNEFIELARSVYKTNDKRFSIKNKINIKSKSEINEVKSYEKY